MEKFSVLCRRFAASLPERWNILYKRSSDPLLRGDLLAYAEKIMPREKYPTAWVEIPADIRRPLVADGRIINGMMPAEFAKAQMTDKAVAAISLKATFRAFVMTAVVAAVFVLIDGFLGTHSRGMYYTAYPQWAADNGAWLPVVCWFILNALQTAWGAVGGTITVALPFILLFPAFWVFNFAGMMQGHWEKLSFPYRMPTREGRLFWKANAITRAEQYKAYCKQVAHATGYIKDQPIIPLGKASGLMRSRWDNTAPVRGQIVGWDGESIRNHTIVTGPTGSGKTFRFMIPTVTRVEAAFSKVEGVKLGAYITDGKGVLFRDLLPIFDGRKDDIRILGTHDGEFGINLCAGMTPLEVSTTFIGVACQLNGNPDDTFWQESASGLLMEAAMIAQGIDTDPEAKAEWIAKRRVRPYSMLGIAQIASEEAIAKEAFATITAILQNAHEGKFDAAEEQILNDAADACDRLEAWLATTAKETVSSIVQNIKTVLGKLVGAPELSRRFCSGLYENECDVDHALKGGVVMVAISQNEHGLAGKVVMCWLKSRLYVAARRREKLDKAATAKHPCMFVCDEAQELLTVGQSGDNEFWNVARSTGVFAIMASQTFATIYEKMGQTAADNFVEQMRTKVFLKAEEKHTVAAAKAIAGEAPRGWEYEENLYATDAAREFAHEPAKSEFEFVKEGSIRLGYFKPVVETFRPYDSSNLWRMMGARGSSRSGWYWREKDGDGKQSMAIGIKERGEDKNRAAFMEGIQYRPRIESDELKIGGGMAFVTVQRAGEELRDLIDLTDIAA